MIAAKGRFRQFAGLVDNCEFGIGEKETTCQDLQGFWDMVYFQVEDVVEKFARLGQLEEKNWVEEVVAEKKVVKKKPVGKKPVGGGKPGHGSKMREMIAARRAALAAAKKASSAPPDTAEAGGAPPVPNVCVNGAEVGAKEEEEKTFDAGFFSVKSPVRLSPKNEETSPQRSETKKRSSKSTGGDRLRRAVLTESAR